jgi:Mrp family chromosome partitioning ATPase
MHVPPIELRPEPLLASQISLGGLGEVPLPAVEDLYVRLEPLAEPPLASPEELASVAPPRQERRDDRPRIKLNLPRWPQIEDLAKTIVGDSPDLVSVVLACASVDRLAAGFSIAAPLARALAGRQDELVLLVESDVRASLSSSETFHLPKLGLAEVFTQQIAWSDAVLPTVIDRLSYLPAGLESRAFPIDGESAAQLFIELKRRFKYVVMDAGPAADALAAGWMARCDEIYLAVELGRTAPHRARDAARQIVAAGGRIRGSIVIDPAR